jgi:hypothetical protein
MPEKIFFKPIIIFRSFDKKGELKSIIQYIDRNNEKNIKKKRLVPIWCLCLSSYLCLALLIILAAAIYVAFSGRSSLYGESCVKRSCIKELNMKCMNNSCSCLSTQYYMKGCNPKKAYLEQCLPYVSTCVDNQDLHCLDGVCKCSSSSYWNGSSCTSRVGYLGNCLSSNQCTQGLQMICDSSKKACLCSSDRLKFRKNKRYIIIELNEITFLIDFGMKVLVCFNEY